MSFRLISSSRNTIPVILKQSLILLAMKAYWTPSLSLATCGLLKMVSIPFSRTFIQGFKWANKRGSLIQKQR